MSTKPYSTNESSRSEHVSEPVASYGLPQDTASLKLQAIDELMNIFDPELLSRAVDYLRSLGREEEREATYPIYPATKEKLMQELAEAEDDFKHGRVYSSDDLRKEMKTW